MNITECYNDDHYYYHFNPDDLPYCTEDGMCEPICVYFYSNFRDMCFCTFTNTDIMWYDGPCCHCACWWENL